MKNKKAIRKQIRKLTSAENEIKKGLKDLKELLAFMQSQQEGDDLFNIRRKLRNELRQLIKVILIYPVGNIDSLINKMVEGLPHVTPEIDKESIIRMEEDFKLRMDDKKYRNFLILFHTGSFKSISPEMDNIFSYDIDSDDKNIIRTTSNNGETISTWRFDEKGRMELISVKNKEDNSVITFEEMKDFFRIKYGIDIPLTMID